MAFTDNCDIFASFHEDGFNRIIHHVRRQRPSLFNYGTAEVANNRALLCKAIDAHPIVSLRSNPFLTIVDPLPIPGTNFGLNFALQLADLKIDFHEGDEFELPSELNPPLKPQRFAIQMTVCGGIGCPPRDIVDQLIPPPPPTTTTTTGQTPGRTGASDPNGAGPPIVVLPARQLQCFCLSAFAVGGVRIATYDGKPYLEPFLDGIEIVDIEPKGLENSMECYITLLLRLVVLPGLRILLQHAPLNLTQGATDLFPQPTNVVISPMPTSAALPNNPAIEDDRLKAFIHVEVM
ncbi:MAG: hypothetical protein ACKV2U_22530 [Bryobacteraceae bacterium]